MHTKKVAVLTYDKNLNFNNIKGYSIKIFSNIDEIKNNDIDLIIVDSSIGHIETCKLISKIKSGNEKKHKSIIIIIKWGNNQQLKDYIRLGANDYIYKPFSKEELTIRLKNQFNFIECNSKLKEEKLKFNVLSEGKNRDAQFKLLIENIPFSVWQNDSEGNYINANYKFAEIIHSTIDDIIGKNLREFYEDDDLREILAENEKVMRLKKSIRFEKIIMDGNKLRSVEVYKTPVFNIKKEVVGIVGILIDITDIKEAQIEIKKQANTDILTNIPNRRALYEYINKEVKLEDELTIMFIDVDNFKKINDTYGHQFGDAALVEIANILNQICKEEFVCRMGGDEFIIIFKDNNDKDFVINKANEILKNLAKVRTYKGENYNISVSIGITNCYYNGDIDSIFMKGDIALYKAKENGKNKFEFYTEQLDLERRLKLD